MATRKKNAAKAFASEASDNGPPQRIASDECLRNGTTAKPSINPQMNVRKFVK
jgi:hypothetical protein